MRHYRTDLVLATGSRGMVLAAYSSGKPTYAVGPGNSPTYVHRSAPDLGETAAVIITSKCFDNGTACASEQAVLADAPIADRLQAEFAAAGRTSARRGAGRVLRLATRSAAPTRSTSTSSASPARRPGDDGRLLRAAGHARARGAPAGRGGATTRSRTSCCARSSSGSCAPSEDEALRTAHALLKYGGDGHTAAIHAGEEAHRRPLLRPCRPTASASTRARSSAPWATRRAGIRRSRSAPARSAARSRPTTSARST